MTLMAFERITADPERMGGVPCIRGLRVTVSLMLGNMAFAGTIEQILDYYPSLERRRHSRCPRAHRGRDQVARRSDRPSGVRFLLDTNCRLVPYQLLRTWATKYQPVSPLLATQVRSPRKAPGSLTGHGR